MKIKSFATSFAIAGALFSAQMARAAEAAYPVTLHGTVQLEKTVSENGVDKQVLSEPKVVVPGDLLLFSTDYQNTGAKAVTNFVITNPLPSAVTLAADGAGAFDVSVDGGKTWGTLVALKVADGKGGTRPAQASDVTHVRWSIASIAPGASGTVSYHAIVR